MHCENKEPKYNSFMIRSKSFIYLTTLVIALRWRSACLEIVPFSQNRLPTFSSVLFITQFDCNIHSENCKELRHTKMSLKLCAFRQAQAVQLRRLG